jgi:hypothetical protein
MILTMYKLSTWLCQKQKYLMLYILIQGPKQQGIDIDCLPRAFDLQEIEILWRVRMPMLS